MYPMLSRICSASVATSYPTTVARPAVGAISPQNIRMVVVLPEPFGPSRPKTSPRLIVRSSRSTATSEPKLLPSPTASTAGGPVTAAPGGAAPVITAWMGRMPSEEPNLPRVLLRP